MARFLLYATVLLVILLVCGISTTAKESNDCMEASKNLFPCISYLAGWPNVFEPTSNCCSGIQNLNRKAKRLKAAPGRICQCIEDIAYVMNIQFEVSRVESLPGKCHLHLSFPISIGMDCSK